MNRLTLRDQVHQTLLNSITDGTLRPGSVLLETELAESFGVSRGTVREALRSLQQAGLVDSDTRGRSTVHEPDAQEIQELFRVRAALEGLAIREIIELPNRQEIVETLREQIPPTQKGEFNAVLNKDLAFHEQICRASGNKILLNSWKHLEAQMRIGLFAAAREESLEIMDGTRHLPVLDAIENGDPAAAEEIIRAHMEEAAQQWDSSMN
ncbi:GntR family transcriptional regulator [Corynebacterium glutamicum]|uniref:GntR family transcriptional regulator n=1 Tax=Corynebacterium glutamicum TaxID=1718 RepID=UPI0011815EFC|nr:GntR family transcriptional regulator [Corynebacterium glutamicum]QDQ19523.1 GntR family transcriptional regulator [Corynebacterium glutamicum]QDQ23088.1 GntR family transcriptional regulator [Corynebacterium glutamicum]